MEDRYIDPHPTAKNTPGYFLGHFDIGTGSHGTDDIVHQLPYEAAQECASLLGLTFRSYSCCKTSGRSEDFAAAKIVHFATLILSKDGTEIGRLKCNPITRVPELLDWVKEAQKLAM